MRVLSWLRRLAMASLPDPLVPPLASRAALWADEVELHLLDLLCDPSRQSVDVGANIGVYSYLMSRRSPRVIAVEPHPDLAAFLRKGLPPNVTVVEAALSDREGGAEIHVPVRGGIEVTTRSALDPAAYPGEMRRIRVRLRTLDDLGCEAPGLLKIDVEGHEAAVLRGGRKLLAAGRPRVLVEVADARAPGSTREVFALMQGLGYEGCYVFRGDVLPLSAFPETRQQPRADAVAQGTSRREGYSNNFIFLPRSEWETLAPRLRSHIRGLGLRARLRAVVRA
jgi:FkbM family methyltransferase